MKKVNIFRLSRKGSMIEGSVDDDDSVKSKHLIFLLYHSCIIVLS